MELNAGNGSLRTIKLNPAANDAMARLKSALSPEPPPNKLTAEDMARFYKIGVNADLLREAKVSRVDEVEACLLVSREPDALRPMAGIAFPYPKPGDWINSCTYSVRRDTPDRKDGKDSAKYMRPTSEKDRPHLYFPPNSADMAKDTTIPVVLVEAEKSTLAITAWSRQTERPVWPIGMNGCWGWRGQNGIHSTASGDRIPERGPLPEMDYLNGRLIYVMLDSNVATNEKVQQAQRTLVRELKSRGCSVRVCTIPARVGDEAVNGPDDLIAAGGDLGVALDSARPADSLEWFNQEYCYVNDCHAIVQLSTMLTMLKPAFIGSHAANRFYDVGTPPERKPLAPAWVAWDHRRQVESMVYEPGKPQFFGGKLNRWRGWKCEPKPGNVAPWTELLDQIFGAGTGDRKWFEQWCAYPLQHPGEKMNIAVILWGTETGTGKTTIGRSLQEIYGENYLKINRRDLTGRFNYWQHDRQFVLVEEMNQRDNWGLADELKDYITGKDVTVEKKNLHPFVVRDTINFMMCSNWSDCVPIQEKDRRFWVWEVTSGKMSEAQQTSYYDEWLDVGGAAHLFHHLHNIDLAGFNPKGSAPMTEAKKEMIENSRTDVGAWIEQLRGDPDSVVGDGCRNAGDLWTPDELLVLYDPKRRERTRSVGLGKNLKSAGFPQRPVKVGKQVQRLYVIRNYQEQWKDAESTEWAEHYAATKSYKPTRE